MALMTVRYGSFSMLRGDRWAIRREWNGRSTLPPLLVQLSNDRVSVITY
jgi:hypothetical protein